MQPTNVKKYRKIVMGFCDINNINKKNKKKRVEYTHHTTLFRTYTRDKKEANKLQLTNNK